MRNSKNGYYTDENRRVRRERPVGRRRGVAFGVADLVMLVVTIVAALTLLAAILAKVIDPRSAALFAFAGLMYQVVWLVNLGCALWWAVRWNRWVAITIVALLIGWGNMKLFYRSDLRQNPEEVVRSREDVVVVTFNVKGFSGTDVDKGGYDEVGALLEREGATIACLQEAYYYNEERRDYFYDKADRLKYRLFVNSIPEQKGSSTGGGFSILSSYPIVRHGVADEDENNVNAIWADLRVGRDTLRVVNAHLQSTGITEEERTETLTKQVIGDTLARTKLSAVAVKMVDNYRQRASEADNIASFIASSPHPVVLCGDFNDTPASYTYRRMKGRKLADSFVEKGRGTEYTFKGLYNLFRIDYILPEEERFEVKEYHSVDSLLTSDHKPVVARLALIEE